MISPRRNEAVIADSKIDASKSLTNSAITAAWCLKVCIQSDKWHTVFTPLVYPKDTAKAESSWTKYTKNVELAILLARKLNTVNV